MPANLTAQYKKAEERYKAAATEEEKLAALEEMLREIPKHKGTDHMQADLKRKISKLKADQQSGKKKSGGRHVDIFHVPPQGAGQVVLIGTPNCGKSSIVGALSKAKVRIEEYPFSTDKPVPGMAYYEDVGIELVDMPPISADFSMPGMVNTYRGCDLIAIVIDLSADVLEQMEVCLDYLEQHRLLLNKHTSESDDDGNILGRKTCVICTKGDASEPGTMETLQELTEQPFTYIQISPQSGAGLEMLMAEIFRLLDIVRVYSKKPGKPVELKDPFTLPRGSTVEDLARQVHRDLAEKLKSARAWGTGIHDGQHVQKTHQLHDKDVIELHFP